MPEVLVLRHPDAEKLRDHLAAMGLQFVREKHGSGPVHWAAQSAEGVVLEVYPSKAKTSAEFISFA